jgi:hypothetical protein
MSFIHTQFLPGFDLGNDVVMLAMDTAGAAIVHATLSDAVQHGSSQLEHQGVTYDFRIEAGAADIELGDGRVDWHLDRATAVEILDDLAVFADRSGHHYVDIRTPTETLVLSNDEYTPEYFEQFPDEFGYAKPGESSV